MDVQTGSLSSSIVDFFKKPVEKRGQDYKEIGNDVSTSNQGLDNGLREDVTLPDGQGSLILYETNSQLRPPVLPILPVQRLRLLRHKQEVRRRLGSDVLLSVAGSQRTPRLSLLDTSYSEQHSSTPSPVKAAGTAEPVETLQVLKSRKVGNNQRRGTRWSGSFDYDLSEYDNHRKEGKCVTNVVKKDHIDSPSIAATKMAAPPGGLFQDINVSPLSAAQRDILLKGQPTSAAGQPVERESTIVAGRSQGDAIDARQHKDKTVLPSIGFDFIKPSDTPSKTGDLEAIKMGQKLQKAESESLQFKPAEQPSKQAAVLPATKPSFTFTALKSNIDEHAHRAREEEEDADGPRRKRAARLFTDTATSSGLKSSSPSSSQDNNKPAFSFGKAVTADKGTTMVSSASTDKKQASQPLFKFGKPNENNEEEKSKPANIGSVPSFSFSTKQSDEAQLNGPSLLGNDLAKSTKTAFSLGSGPESAAQVSSLGKSSEKTSDDSSRKGEDDVAVTRATQAPSFNISTGEKTAEVSKTSSIFGQGAADDKKDSSTSTAFSFGPSIAPGLKGKPAAPSFTFGSSTASDKKDQPAAVPSFSFNGSKASGKEDKLPSATPSFSFGSAVSEKKGASVASSFSFGKGAEIDNKDKTAAPSFSFGKSVEPDNKDKAAAPSFSFGKGVEIDGKGQPSASFSFDSSAASDNKEKPQAPSFSFGTKAAPEKKETAGVPSFSFGNSPSLEKKDQPAAAPSLSFGTANGNDSNRASPSLPTNGFTFKNLNETGGAQKPSFSFGVTDAAKSGRSVFGTGPAQSIPAPVTNNVNFTFNKPSTLATDNDSLSNISGTDNKAGLPSLDFKFGAGTNNNKNTPISTAPTTSVTNPFLGASQNNNNGFSFNVSGTANQNASAFGQTQPSQTAFGTTPSPTFGRSASPIVMNGSNSSSRAFTPSSTINMNFSNNATVNPSSVFSGKPAVLNMAANGPQQLFSNAPPPSQVFGTAPQSNGMAAGQVAQPAQQASALNFQLPPGRKLARMRQSRR
ncbi:hypothetical protein HG536_0D03490 [Torulaspora globosa]|uniref:Uncharacterized protein n=1 Tax=Torulaspora globosa TaxID=48254 RepID=A0A7G3ZH41_9SACH|nr:uncharacterized protein HG536_0D03490 [Torulaspora globosa]QLL32827.1 hypothetical protein HG536_0D03490 [Torulaspora globosa]